MLAIEAAFRRHGIACRVPGPAEPRLRRRRRRPTAQPVVTATRGRPHRDDQLDRGSQRDRVLDPAHRRRPRLQLRQDPRRPRRRDCAADVHADRPARRVHLLLQRGAGGRRWSAVAAPVGVDACAGPMSDCVAVTPLAPGRAPAECGLPPTGPGRGRRPIPGPATTRGRSTSSPTTPTPTSTSWRSTSVTTPTNGGTAVVEPDSRVKYTPPAGAAIGHVDGFDYVVSDGRGGSDTGHVTVTVGGDPCTDPGGFTVLTDPAGDSLAGRPEHDVRSAVDRPDRGREVRLHPEDDAAWRISLPTRPGRSPTPAATAPSGSSR